MKTLFLTIVALAVTTIAFAQSTLKIGHINSQELLQAMPENDSVQVKIEKVAKDLQNQFQTMQNEYTNKYKDFVSKNDSYSEPIRQDKSSELQNIEQRIQQFQQKAEQELQSQRLNLYKPVLDKANKAVSEVAKSNGFTYILDLAQGGVIYYDETSTDILPLVKQKLGLPDIPKSAATNSAIKK